MQRMCSAEWTWCGDDDIVLQLIDSLCSPACHPTFLAFAMKACGAKKKTRRVTARSNDRLFMSDAIQITKNIVEYVRDRAKIDRINYGTLNGRCHRAGLFTCPILQFYEGGNYRNVKTYYGGQWISAWSLLYAQWSLDMLLDKCFEGLSKEILQFHLRVLNWS